MLKLTLVGLFSDSENSPKPHVKGSKCKRLPPLTASQEFRRPSMFAIIETGGKQYRVQKGDVIYVEKLDVNVGDTYEFKEVLVVGNGDNVTIGAPMIPNAAVVAKVVEHGKGPKIIVFRYKAKSRYRKKNGHRQPFTKVAIESIAVN